MYGDGRTGGTYRHQKRIGVEGEKKETGRLQVLAASSPCSIIIVPFTMSIVVDAAIVVKAYLKGIDCYTASAWT